MTMTERSLLRDRLSGPRIADRTAQGWVERPYTRFTVSALSPTIGAEIGGVSLADDVDGELFDELNRALLEWKVLFFRDQPITTDDQIAFARHWGAIEEHPFARLNFEQPDTPEVLRLEKGPAQKGNENLWHSDVTWRLAPSLGSILRAIEVPQTGGDTLWADMGAAYDCLSDDLKQHLDGLEAEHDWVATFGRRLDQATVDELRQDFPIARHPVVRTHPETGRKTLYVNCAFTMKIVGMDPDASDELLQFLYRQAAFPEYQCRFHWQAGDVAFWDNRSTQHYATSDYYPNRRVMERITVVGDAPR
jgi:taurine dioxygenase